MRAIEWEQWLQHQRDAHRKVVFTCTELANAAHAKPRSLSVALQRLVKAGVLVRYASGRYGLPGAVQAEDLLPALDSSAYITGLYALHRHQIITQNPTEITCFTARRHNRSRVRNTPHGRIVFMCVGRSIYSPPQDGVMASAEQALCDAAHIYARRGLKLSTLVSLKNRCRLTPKPLKARLLKYPPAVQQEIKELLQQNT
ncbi:MAG: hypothetical protein KBC05_10545 [Candidatus Hydrogenedentes bacterium]|nr:hypothetical protein [Candidatus Hydrogenedentota bacterium]